VGRRGASPKYGSRDNHRIIWPKVMTAEFQNAWYARVDEIRQKAFCPLPQRRKFLPAARKFELEEVL
jgi:hypothetical protein